uniref:Tail assembly chaperone n=1 Tax=Vibrio phage P018-4 TaxID=3229728 RepID=A0AB39AJJ4_9CAUD
MIITCNKDLSYLCLHHNDKDHKTDVVKENTTFIIIDSSEESVYIVPVGYVTDGYSIPSMFAWLIKNERVDAALLHDFMCSLADEQNDYKLRQYADKVFSEYLLLTGVSKWKANVMYFAVSGYAFTSKIFGKYS